MQKNLLTIIIGILLVLAIGYIMWQNKVERTMQLEQARTEVAPDPVSEVTARPTKLITVTTPLGAPLSGNADIGGIARLVYFEGSFPVHITKSNGTVVWSGPATAQSDWMVTTDVPFKLTIPTAEIPNGSYTLTFVEDNPSGSPESTLYKVEVLITIKN